MTLKYIASSFLMSLSLIAASAQDPAIVDRLTKAASTNALDTIDAQPWHLKLDVSLFDDKGKVSRTGTIEVWQSVKDRRAVYTFGASTLTEITNSTGTYRSTADPSFPLYAPKVLKTILHPGPTLAQINHTTLTIQKHDFGKVALDCITTLPPVKDASSKPFGFFSTYCLDASDHLLASYNFQQPILIEKTGSFLDHVVITNLSMTNAGAIAATAKTSELATYTPVDGEFTPNADMKLFVSRARISGGVIAGLLTKKVAPIYPESARMSHLSGTVVLHAIIGTDGHVQSAEVVSSPDPSLTEAASEAVKQWTYKPYMLNGEPSEVDTTIMVNFNIN